jgi:hypothetical protein
MKTLKLFTLFLIITFNSGCYFLENVIPPEWYAEEDTNDSLNNITPGKNKYPEYVWIFHVSGVECEVIYFKTLQAALNNLRALGIEIFDSYTSINKNPIPCGYENGVSFYAKIKSKDLYLLNGSLWYIMSEPQ